ncbi:MAG: elongation factor 4 [Candidatus Omnitrophica bacterium]|nr:elongation factor 4 [Candidatus Omnitrophota bacterium]MBU3934019.1 translation elongation factor 4 [Candidatus Omnitrophota bacterium]MBU4141077.1 translation elongation factor 4 [Candidatus Omnitrophota bacterium]
MDKHLIRNFSIIAHIDHGKSTLADRLLEYTGTVEKREFREQMLDTMDLERERGITIKASAVRLLYKADDGVEYVLNLIDTPGHVDFTYEVSKSLAACEGALLVVDASQGVEAQTVANLYMAMEHNLKIIPVINKIDMACANVQRVKAQISKILKLNPEDIILASAKEGIGTKEILESIVRKIPHPIGEDKSPLQALIFDSVFNTYKGVVSYVRVVNGHILPGMKIKMMATDKPYEIEELGILAPTRQTLVQRLDCGEVGYISCNIRNVKDIVIGDTITGAKVAAAEPLPGYRKFQPMVFCGIYPVNNKDFPQLRQAMEKLRLNDASFVYEPESSVQTGYGFRCGFLGLLHMEIVQERLEREYNLNLILTVPNVVYKVRKIDGQTLELDSPAKFPPPQEIADFQEPFIRAFIMLPAQNMGEIMELAQSRRGKYLSTEYLSEDTVKLVYELPLAEVIVDFYDRIKSLTRGYGSLDYELKGYQSTRLVKLDILINDKVCDALSSIVHKDKVQAKARRLVEKMKELVPRQLFQVAIQAALGTQIIARETVRPLKKHVTGKCYGGDITRKRKLWEKQKAGKRRMKQFGNVQIPQEAFMAALKI